MPIGLEIAAVLLHAASLILLFYWSIGLGRLIMTMRRHPTARAGTRLAQPTHQPGVCVVIPAHNEEAGIAQLIASLRAQDYPSFNVVLCLDRCTDRTQDVATAAIAGDDRFEVFINTECPQGWAGKVNAIWQGLHKAATPAAREAPILVFADADTTFDPQCLSATVALMHARSLDLLSLLSTLTHDRWFERLAQPAATIETVTQYPILSASRSERRRAFANGQFMMFRRGAYEAVGGHASVHDELLED
ncbi:MAG: glycosyltransferase, partial [Planctomycetota bacterium]|nr:glycosyltransferase [Planctomycetota bacterium]